MNKTFLSINETAEFINNNPTIQSYIKTLIKASISIKKTAFAKAKFTKEFELLQQFELVREGLADFFILNYECLPVCYVLAEVAEEIMGEKIPIEPIPCLNFANRFAEEIRKPAIRTYWYSGLEIQFESYLLVYLHQVHHLDVINFVQNITDEMANENSDLKSVDLSLRNVFYFLNDTDEKLFSIIVSMLSSDRTKQAAYEALQNIGKVNPERADAFYVYSKRNNAIQHPEYLFHILNGLFYLNEPFYLNEAFEIFDKNPVESLLAIAWFDYSDSEQIRKAFEFINNKSIKEIEYLRNLPIFYSRLIENKNTPEGIKQKCFKLIRNLTTQEDSVLRNNLLFRTRMIKGYDKEKYELLHDFMAWGSPSVLNDYFNYFNSAHYLFELIRSSFLVHGMSVDMDLLKNAIHGQYLSTPKEFNQELLKLLTDNIAIIRFAGIQVMMSKYGGVYEVNFLELDEDLQIRAIETLLPLPINIEELLPLNLELRKSPFEKVKIKLEESLKELIWAYDYHLIELLKKHIDINAEADKKLFDTINQAYEVYLDEKERKNKIKELNPLENELDQIEMFFRLEHEKQAESMEEVQSKSVFAQIAKNISVIRGSGFNTEQNTNISIMGMVGASRLIDQRYSINPDKFEWDFKMNALNKNYKK